MGYWNENEPGHPHYQPPVIATTDLTSHRVPEPEEDSDSEHVPVDQENTWGPNVKEPTNVNSSSLDEALADALGPVVSLQGPLPLDPPPMSVNATTMTPAMNPPSNSGMRGVPLAIFDGMCSHTDEFWAQFHRYKLVNHTHDAMVKPFNQVLTALTYIRGPMINNWVNAQEQALANQTNPTKTRSIHEDNEILWDEFKVTFRDALSQTPSS